MFQSQFRDFTPNAEMMTKAEILTYLNALDAELGAAGIKGEMCLYGGTVMCLAFNARPATKDIDAIFQPTTEFRDAARRVADRFGLPHDWINDAVKGFVVPHKQETFLELPSLSVYIPSAEYLLAMKAIAARLDTSDKDDVIFLIRKLNLSSPQAVFDILEKYYPKNQIKPATQFFIEEIFE